jgi:hypothetical protein
VNAFKTLVSPTFLNQLKVTQQTARPAQLIC